MSKPRSSWRMFPVSVAVMLRGPKLPVFPALMGNFTLLVVACFVLAFLAQSGPPSQTPIHGARRIDGLR